MKTFLKIFFLMAVISLVVGCNKTNDLLFENSVELKSAPIVNHDAPGLDQERWVTMKEMNLKVHYRIIGKGPIDVVFLPGWTNPLTVYTKQFDYFRDKARSIYLDPPGHGLSDAPEDIEYTMSLMADAIYEVIKKEGVKKFIAVGFSWAHTMLTQFEMKHPGMISQLVLLDIGINTWPPMTQAIREATYTAYLDMDKSVALNGLIPPVTAPEDLIEWGKYFLDVQNWLLANMYYHYLAEEVCQPYPWSIPILAICRGINPVKEAKFQSYFPNCEIQVIGGDQHCIQWAYHETVNQLIVNFMADQPGKKY